MYVAGVPALWKADLFLAKYIDYKLKSQCLFSGMRNLGGAVADLNTCHSFKLRPKIF